MATKFIVGPQLYSLRDKATNEGDMRAMLKKMREFGATCVQISGFSADISAEAIADALKTNGLTAPATHVSFERMKNDLPKLIAEHHTMGVAYMGLGGMPGEYRASADGFIAFAREFSGIGARVKDAGMGCIYHNHAFEFVRFGGQTGMDILFDNFSDDVQFEVDTFWLQTGGVNVIDWIKKVEGRMDVVHFKDMTGGADNRSLMVPAGTGNFDWPAIFTACDEIGVTYAFLEQDNAVDTDSYACMKDSLSAMKALGATL